MKQLNLFAQAGDTASKEKPPAHWLVAIDGASRNNPGQAGAGVFMKKDNEIVCQEGFYLGVKTNNQAEYLALLIALHFLQEYANPDDVIRIISDSELLVKQVAGKYRVHNEELKLLHSFAKQILKHKKIDIFHVMREDNKDADKLANDGITKKKPLPQSLIQQLKAHGISV